jgi:hypothetical protein
MNISKRVRILAAIVGSGIVVASSACGVDSTAPTMAQRSVTPERASSFAPSEASKALIGVADGVYVVTFNPAVDQHFALGPNHLDIPANSVCNLLTSGYGPAFWNRPCSPQRLPVVLKITIKDANSDKPQVDFQPAMRFNPQNQVQLFFYVPKASKKDAKAWTILYCANGNNSGQGGDKCINEAESDTDLQTYVDRSANVLFRRIKHFSAYRVDASDSGYLMTE